MCLTSWCLLWFLGLTKRSMSPTVAAGIAENGFTASGVVVAPVVVVVAAVAMEEVVVAAVAMEEVVVAAMEEVMVFAAWPPLVQEPLAPLTKWNMTDMSALTAMDGTSASASLFWVCLLYTQLMGSQYTLYTLYAMSSL